MNQMTVVRALESLRSQGGRRFFSAEYKDVLEVGRKTFFHTFGRVESMNWFELGAMQSPIDYMAYMECVMGRRPRVIVETGTASGASAAFYLELLKRAHPDGNVRVITIEIDEKQINRSLIQDPRITSLIGSSIDHGVVKRLKELLATAGGGSVMVMLDSCHSANHVAAELGVYADLVTHGQYLVVQDTYLGLFWGGTMDQGQMREFHEGRGAHKFDYVDCPLGAVEAFLSVDPRFRVDVRPQRWIFTQCPFGFLDKTRA